MAENPIMAALRINMKKPSVASIETVTLNPNSDITERRLIKKQIPNELASPDVAPSVNSPEIVPLKSRGYKIFLSNMLKKSLLIFPNNSTLRKKLKEILGHWVFEAFMLVVIFISSLILVIENPFEDPTSFEQVFEKK